MTKDEMRDGLTHGQALIQEEWTRPSEISAVDELIAEGVAVATPWEYHANLQRWRRRVTGTAAAAPTRNPGETTMNAKHQDIVYRVVAYDGPQWCECVSLDKAVTVAQSLQRHLMGRPRIQVLRGDELRYDTLDGYVA